MTCDPIESCEKLHSVPAAAAMSKQKSYNVYFKFKCAVKKGNEEAAARAMGACGSEKDSEVQEAFVALKRKGTSNESVNAEQGDMCAENCN